VAVAGLSVIQRYLLVPSLVVMVFCGVALAGWTMLRAGSRLRIVWAVGAAALVIFGVLFTALRVNVAKLDSELRFRGDAHAALERAPHRRSDRRWAAALGVLLVGAFVLRVWGASHGLPYAYNADENAHFVPKAIGLFGHSWNPGYFVNPPAFTYLLHVVFAVWYGGRAGVSRTFATDPTSVFLLARVIAALLGAVGVGLLYAAG